MRSKVILLLSLASLGLGFASMGAQAAPGPQMSHPAVSTEALAQPVEYGGRYRNYCGRWREECRERWGFRSWRYRRCMSIHGCY